MLIASIVSTSANAEFTNDQDRINYSLGLQIGNDLLKQQIEFRADEVRRGIEDGFRNNRPRVDPALMQQALVRLKKNISADLKHQAIARLNDKRAQTEKLRQESQDFLQQHRKDPAVVVLDSGLQYRVLKQGSGNAAAKTDTVKFNYLAKTISGQEFDSSKRRGGPISKRADQSIPGISQALQLMKPGSKWELAIPHNLAYGRKGPLANQAIMVELELIEVSKKH